MEKQYIEIVRTLNAELYEKFGEDEKQFSYTTNGTWDLIYFEDEILWNSDNYEVEFDYETKERKGLEKFIRKQFKEYVKSLNKIKL